MLLLLIPIALLAFTGTVAAEFAQNEFVLTLELCGEPEIVLEYGSEYQDPGAQAFVSGSVLLQAPQNVGVSVSGGVDTDTVGTYTITYSAEFENMVKTASRTVYVVDTQPPAIYLVSDPDAYTHPGEPYREEGVSAYDDYDGDVTDQIHSVEIDGVVYYRVKDAAGNVTRIQREIKYDDRTPPELSLLGSQSVTLYQGTVFYDEGCTAVDNCSGDISDRIQVSGSVDYNTVGSYVLTYSVEDDYGNVAQTKRLVHIVQKPQAGKVIYLTFDDGPSGYTNQLLDVLKKYDVKATFFLVNTGAISIAKRIVEEGHAVGIHSITHKYKEIYANEEAFLNDLYGMQKIIYDYTGVTTYLMRFPGGSSNKVSSFNPGIMSRLVKLVEAEGFRYFDWNVSSNDTSAGTTSQKIYQNVVGGISRTGKAVVLQHDIYKHSVAAVESIIQWGLENGYTFAVLDYISPGAHHGVNN